MSKLIKPVKIGFLGTGSIAATVSATLRRMPDMELFAAASRTQERADAFAAAQGFQKAYGSYEELVEDPDVELVYVATPHSRHYEDMRLCIENGKPVLCEKAFTMNAGEAESIRALAREKGVLCAEAIWTRYMPSRQMINELLADGVIGDVHTLTANLSYTISRKQRVIDPELAGGALLDVGIYGLNFAVMHLGTEIARIDTSMRMTDTGVDGMESITLQYEDGKMAVLTHGIWARGDRKGIFYGDKGYMIVENINDPSAIEIYDAAGSLTERLAVPAQISGYEYEFRECAECLAEGRTETSSMPLEDSVRMMRLMDGIRAQWGLIYPKEKV